MDQHHKLIMMMAERLDQVEEMHAMQQFRIESLEVSQNQKVMHHHHYHHHHDEATAIGDLSGTSDALPNAKEDDELRYEVGAKTVTGNTDRWTLKFRKPN